MGVGTEPEVREQYCPIFSAGIALVKRSEYSPPDGGSGTTLCRSPCMDRLGKVLNFLIPPPPPSMIFAAATNAAEVNHNGDDQNQQINASDRLSRIRHPRIH